MDCLLTSNSSTSKFLTEFDRALDRIYAIKHMLPYNRDHVDFLTFVFKNLNQTLMLITPRMFSTAKTVESWLL